MTENDSSTATIGSGGSVTVGLYVRDTSLLNVTGGILPNVQAYNSSTVNISGGTITGLATHNNSTMNLFGTGLTETFLSAAPNFTFHEIKGILQDGTSIDSGYADFSGNLSFNSPAAVPEASSVVSLSVLLAFGLGGLVLCARRRATKAAG